MNSAVTLQLGGEGGSAYRFLAQGCGENMFTTVNGARIYFDVEGAGLVPDGAVMRERPTVLLLHGGPGADHTIHKPDFSPLAEVAQVISYDHRGCGRSDACTPDTWTLAQWGDDVRGLCDALGIVRPIVIGTSFGGFVAQSYAIRHPGHAAKIGLISTAAKVDFPTIYAAFDRLAGPEVAAVARHYWENPSSERRALYSDRCVPFYSVRPPADPDQMARILWRDAPALHFNGPRNEHGRADFRDGLRGVTCPVLVLCGAQDPITPPAFSRDIVAHLPRGNVTFHEYDRCGHGVVGDRPDAMAVIGDFITA